MSDLSTQNIKKKKRKRRNVFYIFEIILCLIALTAILIAIAMIFKYHNMQQEADLVKSQLSVYQDSNNPYYSSEEVAKMLQDKYDEAYDAGQSEAEEILLKNIKNNLLETNSSLDTFKKLFPDEIIIVDNSKYYFMPINENLKQSSLMDSDFVKQDSGRISYIGDKKAYTGIDVSKFQEKINWSKVASDNIDYAIIRVGYRGYSKGEIFDDDTFEDNIEGALKNYLDVGVYFLTQATSESEAIEEAKYVLDKIEPYKINYPVVLDVESVGGDSGRGNSLSMEDRTSYAIAFLDTIKNAGYDVCIYGNLKTFMLMLDINKLENYSKWFAGYTDSPYYPYAFDMWQYTDTGSVNGISETVDINLCFK